ncbi:hypothetical protein SCP_1400500 [Sparassis crispa]|uniref:Uncharacterized protein n=1 Tax=Sparassis crispa TaxID=139825 RepID=A0A401H2I3_9APHY|nr:hypothetical protein SCP_1400500 [Sparassis crispa]GBE88645.1 hypothetical protein SCP_1400500 [Sparassis crispa]
MHVSVIGGIYMKALGLRLTKLKQDADVLIPKSGPWNRFNIINEIAKQDPCFTVNMEVKCGLTFKEGDEVYTWT